MGRARNNMKAAQIRQRSVTTTVIANISSLDECPECGSVWSYYVTCDKCGGTGANSDGEACANHSCAYNPESGKCDGEHTAHCCQDGQRGPFKRVVGVQYTHDSPQHYDGVSEWLCPACDARWGRWSGRRLRANELEPRFGESTATV